MPSSKHNQPLLSLRLYISIPIPGGPKIDLENSASFLRNLFTQTTFPNLNLPKSCSTSHGSLTYTLPTRHSSYFCSTDTILPQHLLQANYLKHIGITHVTPPHLLWIHLLHFTHRRVSCYRHVTDHTDNMWFVIPPPSISINPLLFYI